jgi:hypothetical protein
MLLLHPSSLRPHPRFNIIYLMGLCGKPWNP